MKYKMSVSDYIRWYIMVKIGWTDYNSSDSDYDELVCKALEEIGKDVIIEVEIEE